MEIKDSDFKMISYIVLLPVFWYLQFKLWNYFVPIFHITELSYWQIVGLDCLIGLFKSGMPFKYVKVIE